MLWLLAVRISLGDFKHSIINELPYRDGGMAVATLTSTDFKCGVT